MPITSEESVRRWPRWVARIANLVPGVRWTKDYCSAGCGYPVTGACAIEIDRIEAVPVLLLVCSLGGDCEYNVRKNPRDASGTHYSDIRPQLVEAVKQYRDDLPQDFKLSFGR